MMLPLRGLGSAVVMLVLAMGPSTGCGDDLPDVFADGDGQGSTSTSSTSSPPVTTVTSADGTVGSMSDSLDSTVGPSTSSSGDPGSSGSTTLGVSATESSSSSDGTTSGSSSSDGSSSDSSSSGGGMTSGMTSGGGMTSGMTSGGGMTSGMTSGGSMTSGGTDTDMTSDMGTTDVVPGSTSGGTTSGGTTDMTDGGGATDDGETEGIMEVPDFSGDFLFVVATPLDPTLPFQYIANFDFVPSGFGGGTVDVELQPLALDTSSTTTPRTFFGPPMVFPALPVTPDGTFAIPVGILSVAAETNPLYPIDAQANNVVFTAQVLDADDVCGTVTGMLVFPVASPLDGTTFAAVRVADIMPPSLPVVFPIACP